MDKTKNPGAGGSAHGASSRVQNHILIIAPHPAEKDSSEQELRPATRFELIRYGSLMSLFESSGGMQTYDTVPDQSLTDPAVGCLAVRERVFLTLACLVESLNGGWRFDVKQGVEDRFVRLIREFGDYMNTDLVEKLFMETLENEDAMACFLAGAVRGADNV